MIEASSQQAATQQPKPSSQVTIRQVSSAADVAATASCFHAYTEWLNEDISFQNYDSELNGLPGKYAPPSGALLLARDSATNEVLGCIALRPLTLQSEYQDSRAAGVRYCEIKRLFVYPAARGRQVARSLIKEVLAIATREGYGEVLLDTLGRMEPAIGLYKSEGFGEVEPYCYNPLRGVVYLGRKLDSKGDGA